MLLQSRRRLSPWKMVGLGLLGLAALAALPAWHYGRAPLGRWLAARSEQKSLGQARDFAAKGDVGAALLAVRAAAAANPGSIDTQRQAAALFEQAGSASAVKQREEVSLRVPDSRPDRLAWAEAALRFRDLDAAEQALAGFSADELTTPEVAHLLAALALARREPAPAREALAAALAQNPSDTKLAFQLAALDSRGANPEGYEAAKRQLQVWAASGPQRQAARRELALASSARSQLDEAAQWVEQLASDPEATFDDQIRRLNAQRGLHGWTPADALAQASAHAKTPAQQAQLANWLMVSGQPQKALDWIASLAPAESAAPRLLSARADAAAALKKWPEVLDCVAQGAWGKISENALLLIRTSQIVKENHRREVTALLWADAAELERNNPAGQQILYRLAGHWGLPEQKELILREIAQSSTNAEWAFQQLAAIAFTRKDTAGLCKLWALQLEVQPQNRQAANDWAFASLLLNPDAPDIAVQTRVDELARLEPENPRFLLTRALALWRDGKPQEALALLETLSSEERTRPGTALYHGALLVANQRRAEATLYLKFARSAQLLPEEARLLQVALTPATL